MIKKFIEILEGATPDEIRGNTNISISAIRFDSRAVAAGLPGPGGTGDLFVAVRGFAADGHNFIEKAIENGAVAVVCEAFPDKMPPDVVFVKVKNSAEVLGKMASKFYDSPSQKLTLVGITGTNGKTTVATLLWQLFTALGHKSGLIGTVENRIGDETIAATHTTPDPVALNFLLKNMLDSGCTHVFMEVSSHAVEQKRIAGLHFSGGVFTNLTHDHLDYHKTFANYRDAKKQFFDDLPTSAFALTNADDKNGKFMQQNTTARKTSFGLKNTANFKTKILENSLTGLHLQMDGVEIFARMIGEFNASNLTAAYAVARELGVPKMDALTALSNLQGAEGRFDYLSHPTKNFIAIVDYAHTPDALEKVLETIQKLKKKTSKIIVVTGAGGDRDKTKRPIMAQIAAKWSDQLILTSDNPRTENPAQILKDMEAGLSPEFLKKTLTIENREQAIKTACRLAQPTDVILVAGKGHEKYQDIMGVKHPFDDKKVLIESFEG